MKKKYFNRILLVMCACVIAYAFLLPLLFMLFTSFKGLAEAMTSSTLRGRCRITGICLPAPPRRRSLNG